MLDLAGMVRCHGLVDASGHVGSAARLSPGGDREHIHPGEVLLITHP
jgi:hypothetical protein